MVAACRARAAAAQQRMAICRGSGAALVVLVVQRMMCFVHVIGANTHLLHDGDGADGTIVKMLRLVSGEAVLDQNLLKCK